MSIFDVLALFGGLALFLFGMNVMGDGLTQTSQMFSAVVPMW